jgi:hypothetical protein
MSEELNNKNNCYNNTLVDDSMMTPYGLPSPYAYIMPIPNDAVGLIIGRGGDTVRNLS